MAPKFGLDDGSSSNFDTTLVLASMLASQLRSGTSTEPQQAEATSHGQADQGPGAQKGSISEHPSDQTRIWSELSGNWVLFLHLVAMRKFYMLTMNLWVSTGSAARSNNASEDRQVRREANQYATSQREIQRIGAMHISNKGSSVDVHAGLNKYPSVPYCLALLSLLTTRYNRQESLSLCMSVDNLIRTILN